MRFRIALFAVVLVSLTGCRMYGGHGSEAATANEIQDMLAWVDAEQERLQADVTAVEAANLDVSGEVAIRLQDLSVILESTRSAWEARSAGLDGSSAHGTIRRALTSMISERQIHEDEYARIASLLEAPAAVHAARYQVAPVFYARIASRLDAQRIRDLATTR